MKDSRDRRVGDIEDLEEGYSDSEGDDGVEIGEFAEDDMDEADLGEDMDEDLEDDGFEGLESGDEDAMLGDDEDLPSDFEGLGDDKEEEDTKKEEADNKKKKKRKLKHLPTFASMDDYAKLLGADDEDM